MARPLSQEKHTALLNAATQVVAEQGISAPTAKIARVAGVAEGTLFTYFSTKEVLFNQLYLKLKASLSESMMESYPHDGDLTQRMFHTWEKYIDWGIAHPAACLVVKRLSVSGLIAPETVCESMDEFADINRLLVQAIEDGVFANYPVALISATIGALAESTMDFITQDPASAAAYKDMGFRMMWKAISA